MTIGVASAVVVAGGWGLPAVVSLNLIAIA